MLRLICLPCELRECESCAPPQGGAQVRASAVASKPCLRRFQEWATTLERFPRLNKAEEMRSPAAAAKPPLGGNLQERRSPERGC